MLRIKLAEWLLRSAGADCEYRVKRHKAGWQDRVRSSDGITQRRTNKLREALKKYNSALVPTDECFTVQFVATVRQRHGNVEAK